MVRAVQSGTAERYSRAVQSGPKACGTQQYRVRYKTVRAISVIHRGTEKYRGDAAVDIGTERYRSVQNGTKQRGAERY